MYRVLLDAPLSTGMRARQNLGGRFNFEAPRGGHHPRMVVTVSSGVPIVSTSNQQLVERLLANHRDARMSGARPPSARLVR